MEFINYEADGAVAVLTINRPKALNALNSAVLDEINEALMQLISTPFALL